MPSAAPRERTKEELYRLIRAQDGVTRGELVDSTGLSRSTVNGAVARLLGDGRVVEVDLQEKGPGSGSGRPGTRLVATASGSPVAGIDFGHNHLWVALADALGRPLAERRVELNVDLQAHEALDIAADLLAELCREQGVSHLGCVVAGIPGPLQLRSGMVQSPTILSGWVGLDPSSELAARIGVPVRVENDAVLGAYGERLAGAGRRHDDFLYVKASHGIGASLVLNGTPYLGATGLAGEIGHTQLPGRSELCRCGNRGCLEAVVSMTAVGDEVAHTHPATARSDLDIAAMSDPVTARILHEAGRTLGGVLACLCNLVNPSAVIVGGELGATGQAFVSGVEASIQRHAQPATTMDLVTVPAELGVRAELVGALELAALGAPAPVPAGRF